jgi:CHAD domain-containing protein
MKTAESKNLVAFVESNLQSRLKKIASNLRKTAKDPEDAGHIHDLRVAIRRYTQGLRIFKHLLNGGRVKKMRRRLKTVMEFCGTIRNCDIALEVLKAAGAEAPAHLKRRLDERRSDAMRDLGDFVDRSGGEKTTKQWSGWLRAKPGPEQTIACSARRVLRPMTKDFLDAGVAAANPETTPMEMHQFRLMAKRFRYSLEIFSQAAGPECKRWITQVRALQEHLGGINDCVTTRDLIAEPGNSSHRLRDVKAAVERLLEQRIEVFRKYWNEHLQSDQRRRWLAQADKIGTEKIGKTANHEHQHPEARNSGGSSTGEVRRGAAPRQRRQTRAEGSAAAGS